MVALFAGLDVSQKMTSICIVNVKGKVIFETDAETAPAAIAEALKPYKRQLKSVGQEAGNAAPWLETELKRAKFPMVCLDPLRASLSLKAKLNKTDTNDARGLAQLLASGIFVRAHVKSVDAIRIRAALVLREAIVAKERDLTSALRMSERRLVVDEVSRKRSVLRSESRDAVRMAKGCVRSAIANLQSERAKLDKMVASLAKGHDICQRLMTIPGVGPITALTFVAAIDDPTRFKSSRHVGAYFGLTPRRYQSGEVSKSGGISHRGDSSMRKALFIAATSLVARSGTDCSLRRWGRKLASAKGAKVAYIAVARKLAVLMHHLWLTGQEFDRHR